MSLKLCYEHLACVLGALQGESKYVYITGDFNVNTLHIYNGGLARQEFINMFSSRRCVYRPPFMSLKLFNEHLACVLDALQGESKYVYITGDFNVNISPYL